MQATAYTGIEGVELVGAADVSSDARELFEDEFGVPAYEDYRTLLDERAEYLDAVTIVTPHTHHYEQAKACLERDFHVLVEKPMVTDVDHAVDLIETAEERGLVLQVGYQRHFHPAFEEIRRIIRSGRIGDVHAVNCFLGQDWIDVHRETWRSDPALSGGGQLYDSGSHLLDVLLWTTDTEPAAVSAQIEYAEPEVDVNSSLSIRLGRGADTILASILVSGDGVDTSPSEGYFYWGTEGMLSFADGRITVAEKGAATYRTEIDGGADFQTLNRKKLENFIASTEGRAEPAVPGEVGLQVTALTEGAYRAADSGSETEVQSLIESCRSERD